MRTPGPSPEYLPFEPGPFRLSMGVKPLDLAQWIEIDAHFVDEMAQKRRLLACERDEVLVALPRAEAASRELCRLLSEHLCQRFPEWFAIERNEFVVRLTGERYPLGSAMHPLELAARWVQEDLVLMEELDGAYRLTAGAVCFPSRWRVREKLSASLDEIHEPVAFYPEQLSVAVNRFFRAITPQRPVWRVNWNVHETDTLFQLGGTGRTEADPNITPRNAGERLFLRIERQTLRRLPETGAIAFTIRTYLRPLADFAAHREVAARLAAVLRAMPPQTRAYKSQAVFLDAALAWLDGVS